MEEIEKVIATFDFDKVHKAMVAVDWKWTVPGTNDRAVPNKKWLIEPARELLTKLIKLGRGLIRSGGFVAGYYENETSSNERCLGLSFVLETSDFFMTGT